MGDLCRNIWQMELPPLSKHMFWLKCSHQVFLSHYVYEALWWFLSHASWRELYLARDTVLFIQLENAMVPHHLDSMLLIPKVFWPWKGPLGAPGDSVGCQQGLQGAGENWTLTQWDHCSWGLNCLFSHSSCPPPYNSSSSFFSDTFDTKQSQQKWIESYRWNRLREGLGKISPLLGREARGTAAILKSQRGTGERYLITVPRADDRTQGAFSTGMGQEG